jgi:hypothetical protein
MDGPAGTLHLKTFSAKLQAYEALYSFNRLIETTLESLEQLERLGFLRSEDLNEYKIRIEHARAGQSRPDRPLAGLRNRGSDSLRSHGV